MTLTPSSMLPLGTPAPDFSLPDAVSGKTLSLNEIRSEKATVIFFICNHCPYVKHIAAALGKVAKKYQENHISFAGICSNDIAEYPEDHPDKLKDMALRHGYSFPYLFDASQATAKAYQAACTPDFYVFDKQLACVYRGRFDDSTPGNGKPVTGKDLCDALEAVLENRPVNASQMPSIGCNIKWKTES